MQILNNFYAFEGASEAAESEPTTNVKAETLTVQIEGSATSMSLKVLGCSDLRSDEYQVLPGVTSDFSLTSEMTANGLYTVPVEGMGRFKFDLASVSGGEVTVFCRMTTGG